jgi:hypothetical protein
MVWTWTSASRGPYRVNEQVAAGRLGTVFRAVHVEFEQPVSLKVFSRTLARHPEQLGACCVPSAAQMNGFPPPLAVAHPCTFD